MAVKKRKRISTGVTFDTVREIAQTLPGAEESTSYGTPAFKVKGKLFARQHQDGESLVIGVDFDAREEMMTSAPEKFYITDHYLKYPWMLVRMSKVNRDELRDLLIGSWRRVAGKTTPGRRIVS
ncbi:MAG TPA: MmcQ/YjbR family DNA-binding protein [Pyrinomonadaceae bacterium]|nr:MmcQ/YjbR family DNA-binding protein [Pyrinomonadaceae bacterium]